ncbi:TetR/AcrR family transcriptional regulator [Rhodococcus sp. ACT016]|uniref:TetR/AcrR family transcriptional regulator n=1 Tax=Rhodococcus sp. ACT016 TaxID=3134808 RepID=UPI003D2E222D
MPASAAGRGAPRRGRPPSLSAERIVVAAREHLEAGGLAALSMRALAKDLGTTPMALYRHVGDKEQLLGLVLDEYSTGLGDIELPEQPRERIQTIFLAIFDTLAAEAWILELLQRGGRGGAGALVLVDRVIAAGQQLGMDGRRALLLYRALWNYTLGALLDIRPVASDDGISPLAVKIREAGVDRLPALHAVAENWPSGTTRESYVEGLRVLADGYVARFGDADR